MNNEQVDLIERLIWAIVQKSEWNSDNFLGLLYSDNEISNIKHLLSAPTKKPKSKKELQDE